jgi:hypothetical protein
MEINQPKWVKPKTRGCELRSGVNWYGTFRTRHWGMMIAHFYFAYSCHRVKHMKNIKLITSWEQVVTTRVLDHWIIMPHHKQSIHR